MRVGVLGVLLVMLVCVSVVVAAEPTARLDIRDYYVYDGDRVTVTVELKNLENATSFEVNLGYPENFDYLYVDEWDDWNFDIRDKPFGPEGLHYLQITGEAEEGKVNGSKDIKVVFYANCEERQCNSYFELGRVYINDERIDIDDEREYIIVANPFYVEPTPTTTIPTPTPTPTPTPEPKYVVVINSEPANAKVYIDGELKGTTPAILRLEKGVYALKIEKTGYKSKVDVLRVDSDTTKTYKLEKEKKTVVTPSKVVTPVTPVTPKPEPKTTTKADYSWVGWLIGLGILGGLVYMFRKTRRETIEENVTYIVGDDPHEWIERKTLFDGGVAYDKMRGTAFLARAGRPVVIKRADGTTETVWLVDGKTGAGIILERGELLEGKTVDIDGVDEEGKPAKVKFKLNTNPKMISDLLSANLLREMAKLKPSMGQVIVALFAGLLIGYLFGLVF